MNILIVDDSKFSRKILREIIRSLGYTIIAEANNGDVGYAMFKELKPDVIITDIEMPVMDGITMSAKISAISSNVKIIVVSSVVNKKVTQKALLNGASMVLTKPIDEIQLNRAINGGVVCK